MTTCANNVADTIASVYGVNLNNGSYDDGSYAEPDDGPTTFGDIVLGIVILFMSLMVMLIIVLFVFRVFIAPIGHAAGWNWGPFAWGYMAGSARRHYRPGPPPPPGPGFGPGYGPGYGPGPRNDRPRPPRNNNRRPPRPPMGGGFGGGSFGGSRGGGSFGGGSFGGGSSVDGRRLQLWRWQWAADGSHCAAKAVRAALGRYKHKNHRRTAVGSGMPAGFSDSLFTDGVEACKDNCRADLDGKHCNSLFNLLS